MGWNRRIWMTLAAASALVSIAAGALAAHGVGDPTAKDLIRTGANYQFMHAMACIAAAVFVQLGARRANWAPPLFLAGTVLFSGSLYALAWGAPRWLGAVTPAGGLMFLAGWAVLIWAGGGIDRQSAKGYEGGEPGRP